MEPSPKIEADEPTPAAAMSGRRKFTKLLQPFAVDPGIVTPLVWFFLDWLVLGVAIASLLIVDNWWIKIFASMVAALWIARLFVIGHDACHGSYTPSQTLNKWIGRIAFLPSLTPYSLWEIGHNLAHHGFTNLKGRDYVWTPYSPSEFARLSWIRRQLERIYRSGVGQGVYYMVEMWWKKLFFPRRKHVSIRRTSYTVDSLLVASFAAIWIGGLVVWALHSGRSVVSLLIFAFAVPFFLWNCLMGFVVYVQHTHPRVAWYERRDEWSANAGYATTTVHVKLMRPFDGLIHYILEHGAHHVNMGIPLVSPQGGSGSLDRHSRRAAELGSFHVALLLEHGAALQAVRFRAARVDRLRRPHHLGALVRPRYGPRRQPGLFSCAAWWRR